METNVQAPVTDSLDGTQTTTVPVNPSPAATENGDITNGEPTPATSQGNAAETQKQRNLDAEAGKISALQKQVNELNNFRGEISAFFEGDPDGYERFRKHYKTSRDVDLPDYSSLFGKPSTLTEQPKQPEDVRKIVRDELKNEMEVEQGFNDFLTAVPDMDPKKMTPERLQEVRPIIAQIEAIAISLKQSNPSMKLGDAYVTAYRALHPGATVAQNKEAQETIAQLNEIGNGVGQSSAPAASTAITNKNDTSFLSETERQTYNRLLNTPGKEGIAKIFLENVRERKSGG